MHLQRNIGYRHYHFLSKKNSEGDTDTVKLKIVCVALTLSVIEAGLVVPNVLFSVLVRSCTLPVGLARGPLALRLRDKYRVQPWSRQRGFKTTNMTIAFGRDYLQQTAKHILHLRETVRQ